jgi:hypothetical protein
MNMEGFEVIERIKERNQNQGEFVTMAIRFLEPTCVKFTGTVDLKKGSMVSVDGSDVIFNGKPAGKVLKILSGDDVRVDTSYDIKYTGGYSLDGKTMYLDEHFPPLMEVEGNQVDSRKSIGLHHELPEKWLADEKYEYPYAHEVATGIEKKYVESLGVTWQGYCRVVDSNLRRVYSRTLEKSPPSLDLAPYLYCRDREALNEIRNSEDTSN